MSTALQAEQQRPAAQSSRALLEGWMFLATQPDQIDHPDSFDSLPCEWIPARTHGHAVLSPDSISDPDSVDCWFRLSFPRERAYAQRLVFEGLATLAEVFLNGECLLQSRNMFRSHAIEIADHLEDHNELLVVCRALSPALGKKHPRPGWKTNLVSEQTMRWYRTTLLGRTAGWGYHDKIVGIWLPVQLVTWQEALLDRVIMETSAKNGVPHLRVDACLAVAQNAELEAAWIEVAGERLPLNADRIGTQIMLTGEGGFESLELWWPHTHGTPTLYPCRLLVKLNGQELVLRQQQLGFRSAELLNLEDAPALIFNGQRIFTRGACWTVTAESAPLMSDDELEQVLRRVAEAGANLIRIGGTMCYESETFYRLCDELGLMVWQDFMFANMDYRCDDVFEEEVEAEVRCQVARLAAHPSVAVFCGNSEIEQQAVMMGQTVEAARQPLFYEKIPAILQEIAPGLPYAPGSPSIGGLPFHSRVGIAHYFGVGAYQRPLNDHSLYEVGFATEALGFSNVPDPAYTRAMFGSSSPGVHEPEWKRGVARDARAGWDFEDTRDRYLREMFRVDPVVLRTRDNPRYLALSRIVTGEIMAAVYGIWRGSRSRCNGALVWHLKDLLPGAGWGVLDASGEPKPVYWYLKRAWSPQAVMLEDGGLEGTICHVVNDCPSPLQATLEVMLIGDNRHRIADAQVYVGLEAGCSRMYSVDDLLGRFYDSAYAYRFGPAAHQVVGARLVASDDTVISQSCLFPDGYMLPGAEDAEVDVSAIQTGERAFQVRISSNRFLQAAFLDLNEGRLDDNYFHVLPDTSVNVNITDTGDSLRGQLTALNTQQTIRWRV